MDRNHDTTVIESSPRYDLYVALCWAFDCWCCLLLGKKWHTQPQSISVNRHPTVPPHPLIDGFTVPGYALYFAQTMLLGLRPRVKTVGNCSVVTGETPPFVFCVKRVGVYIFYFVQVRCSGILMRAFKSHPKVASTQEGDKWVTGQQ